jgi:predicted nucleotidyltransferase
MSYGLDDDDIVQINAVFAAHPNVQEVIIFGSRAMGNYKPGSDIDLVVKGDQIKHADILDLCTELDDLGMLYTFDVQRYNAIKDRDVLDHIKRAGKQFYGRP